MDTRDTIEAMIDSFTKGEKDWARLKKHFFNTMENFDYFCRQHCPVVCVTMPEAGETVAQLEVLERKFHFSMTPALADNVVQGHIALYQMINGDVEILQNLIMERNGVTKGAGETMAFQASDWSMEMGLALLQPMHEALKKPSWSYS